MGSPRISGAFTPQDVGEDTVWVSADGAWVLAQRRTIEAHLGRGALGADPMGQTAQDLGMLMGTGVGTRQRGRRARPVNVDVVMVPEGGFADAVVELEPVDLSPRPEPAGVARTPRAVWVLVGASVLMLVASMVTLVFAMGWIWWRTLPPTPTASTTTSSVLTPVPAMVVPLARDTGDPPGASTLRAKPGWPPAGRDPNAPNGARPRRAQPAPSWQVYMQRGWRELPDDPTSAADSFQRALVLYPTHADAHRGLGEARLAMGQVALGTASLCEARRLDGSLAPLVSETLTKRGLSCAGVGGAP